MGRGPGAPPAEAAVAVSGSYAFGCGAVRRAGVIEYRRGNDLDLDAVIDVYVSSTLGERRPVEDRARMAGMLRESNLVVTAWDGALLVGIARSMSDFHYATYLSDLAVRLSHQRLGIGVELMRRTREAAPLANLILLAAPAAVEYYPKVGFTAHPSAWILRPGEPLRDHSVDGHRKPQSSDG